MEYDLDHVALRRAIPRSSAAWHVLGFPRPPRRRVHRVGVAGAYLELLKGERVETDRPLLNHVAVLVDEAEEWRATSARGRPSASNRPVSSPSWRESGPARGEDRSFGPWRTSAASAMVPPSWHGAFDGTPGDG